MLPPKTKFSGILNDLNLEVIDQNLINELISRGIYKKNEADWMSNFLKVENSIELSLYLHYNSSNYTLNEEISDEIFEQLEFFIEHIDCDFESNKKKFFLKLNAYVDVDKKIKFLKKLYKKDYVKLTKDNDVLIYFGQEENGFTSWKDYIIHSIDSSLIKQHLKDEILFYKTDIIKTWSEYRSLKSLTDLYLKTIEKLSNPKNNANNKTKTKSLGELIFIEDGEEIFNFIVSKYPKSKTKAFFSYLFFFIKKIEKSNIEGNDSVDYRQYILEEFEIEFPRIINSISTKQPTKEKINILFNKYFIEYKLTKMNEK
jgi:hypothetical protein